MSAEYDLVIIGGPLAAREMAIAARSFKARVALVEPPTAEALREPLYRAALGQWVRAQRLGDWANQSAGSTMAAPLIPDWQTLTRSIRESVKLLEEARSPAVLSAFGIDVIAAEGEFHRLPHLGFRVNGRSLRSRAYLVASGARSALPAMVGLERIQPQTPESIWHPMFKLPSRLVILGSGAIAVELAQAFCRLGTQVTLIAPQTLLPQFEPEAARLIQAQLEAEGVRILTHTEVSQVRPIDGKIWLQVQAQALETDEILVAMGRSPAIQGLNLEGLNVTVDPDGIAVNARLQTSHPRIYACGSVIHGDLGEHAALRHGQIALKNALWMPWFKVRAGEIPKQILTDPAVVSVGMTEAEARDRYHDRIVIQHQPFKTLPKACLREATTGFCKLIARPTGQILGIHLVGPEAEELGAIAALAIQQRCKVKALANLPVTAPSFAEVLRQTAIAWQQQRLQQQPQLQDWIENWFEAQRGKRRWLKG